MTIQLVEATHEDERGPFLMVADHIATLLNEGQVRLAHLVPTEGFSCGVIWPPIPIELELSSIAGREDCADRHPRIQVRRSLRVAAIQGPVRHPAHDPAAAP